MKSNLAPARSEPSFEWNNENSASLCSRVLSSYFGKQLNKNLKYGDSHIANLHCSFIWLVISKYQTINYSNGGGGVVVYGGILIHKILIRLKATMMFLDVKQQSYTDPTVAMTMESLSISFTICFLLLYLLLLLLFFPLLIRNLHCNVSLKHVKQNWSTNQNRMAWMWPRPRRWQSLKQTSFRTWCHQLALTLYKQSLQLGLRCRYESDPGSLISLMLSFFSEQL